MLRIGIAQAQAYPDADRLRCSFRCKIHANGQNLDASANNTTSPAGERKLKHTRGRVQKRPISVHNGPKADLGLPLASQLRLANHRAPLLWLLFLKGYSCTDCPWSPVKHQCGSVQPKGRPNVSGVRTDPACRGHIKRDDVKVWHGHNMHTLACARNTKPDIPNMAGQIPWKHLVHRSKSRSFWGRCTTHFGTYFSGDWDVHWDPIGFDNHSHVDVDADPPRRRSTSTGPSTVWGPHCRCHGWPSHCLMRGHEGARAHVTHCHPKSVRNINSGMARFEHLVWEL